MLLNDLLSQTRLVTVPYGDAELNIEYYWQRLTDVEGQRLIASLRELSGFSDQSFAVACQVLVRVIAWWDLYESEGVPLPITVEALRRLPIGAISDVVLAIVGNETRPPTVEARVL